MAGGRRPRDEPGRHQEQGGAGLELRHAPLESRRAVGHGIVILENTVGPVGQARHLVILGVKSAFGRKVARQGLPGVFQAALAHLPGAQQFPAFVKNGPAVIIRKLLWGKGTVFQRRHDHFQAVCGGGGRVDKATAHEPGQRPPPKNGKKDHHRACGEQIPPEKGRKTGAALHSLFHL